MPFACESVRDNRGSARLKAPGISAQFAAEWENLSSSSRNWRTRARKLVGEQAKCNNVQFCCNRRQDQGGGSKGSYGSCRCPAPSRRRRLEGGTPWRGCHIMRRDRVLTVPFLLPRRACCGARGAVRWHFDMISGECASPFLRKATARRDKLKGNHALLEAAAAHRGFSRMMRHFEFRTKVASGEKLTIAQVMIRMESIVCEPIARTACCTQRPSFSRRETDYSFSIC